jgi:hypothetical protein
MKKKAYILLSCIAPLAVLIAALFIANADVHSGMQQMIQYRYAFYSFVIVAMCIEIRVRMRFRLQRTRLFWVHLSCAVPFFLILGILAFFIMPFSVSIVEGAVHWSCSLHSWLAQGAVYKKLRKNLRLPHFPIICHLVSSLEEVE